MTDFASDWPTADSIVLHEAAHLLQGLTVSPDQAAFVEGERVTIFIAPSWEEDQTFALCFTCRPWGHQRVDWTRLVLWACAVTDAPRPLTYRIGLDVRGQHGLAGCEPVEYVLRALYLDEAKRLSAPPARRTATDRLVIHGAPVAPPAETLPEIRVLRSPESKITATMIARATQLEIVFETRTAELAGAIVHLWRQGEKADVLEPVAELPLQPAEGQAWRASWSGPALPIEQHFAFTVVPAQSREGGPS